MTTLKATFDPFVGTLTTTNMASYCSPQWLRIFSTTLAQKYKIWRLKLPKWTKYLLNTDIMAFLGVSGSVQDDFFTKTPILKNYSPEQKSCCRTCAVACHSPFNKVFISSIIIIIIIIIIFAIYTPDLLVPAPATWCQVNLPFWENNAFG